MLSAEAAKERLKEFETAGSKPLERQFARVKSLPTAEMRAAGFGLLGRDAEGRHFSATTGGTEANRLREKAKHDAAEAMDDRLSPSARESVWRALLPGLAPALDAFWTSNAGLYQDGYARRAFHAPGRPDLTRESRLRAVGFFLDTLTPYDDQDAVWLAAWAPYVSTYYGVDYLGRLLAAAIDRGGVEGDAVFDVLKASGNGEHEIGAMGRHVTRALLSASRPDGWEWVEKLLLAAQRQEGLRQTVLEAVDEAHPEAFRRMIRLIQSEELTRFSATIRALDTWFGFGWDAPSVRQAGTALAVASAFLDDPDMARLAARPDSEGDAQTAYLALWSLAYYDAPATVSAAAALLSDGDAERRFAAAHLLAEMQLPEARLALLPSLDDPDLRVAARAFGALHNSVRSSDQGMDGLFELFERNLPRFPKTPATLGPIIWPWMTVQADRSAVADALVGVRQDRPAASLLPYLGDMDSYGRGQVADLYCDPKMVRDAAARDVLLKFAADASSYVRSRAHTGLALHTAGDETAARGLEGLLTRKSEDSRRAIIGLLMRQSDEGALASARRLMATKPSSPQRAAGLDLLSQMVAAKRSPEAAHALAQSFSDANPQAGESEKALLQDLLDTESETPTLDNALGLMDPANLTPSVRPTLPAGSATATPTSFLGRVAAVLTGSKPQGPLLATDAAGKLITAIDAFVEQHREMPITVKTWQSDGAEVLLGSAMHSFPAPDWKLTVAEDRARMPLFETWEAWWVNRGPELRDADGLEGIRARAAFNAGSVTGVKELRADCRDDIAALWPRLFASVDKKSLKHTHVVGLLLDWAHRLFTADEEVVTRLFLDGARATLALLPDNALGVISPETQATRPSHIDCRYSGELMAWVELARGYRRTAERAGSPWDAEDTTRLWRLLVWKDRPLAGMPRLRPALDETLAAFRVGAATADDVYDLLLGPSENRSYGFYYHARSALSELSGRKPHAAFETTPGLREIVDRCRTRVIDVEIKRGDTPTAATRAAQTLRYAGGAETLIRLLSAMGKTAFVRGSSARGDNRAEVFSRLVRATFPADDDSPAAFAEKTRAARIDAKRLIEMALYAPQWARRVEEALQMPQFAEAVWWLHAHTKDSQWTVDQETREAWAGEISDKTPLTAADLVDGAVDVAWFARVYAALGQARWKALDEAAKFASSSGGHKRAQLYADAMLGRLEKSDLMARVKDKRNQDAVRALGLLPLPDSDSERQADALERYKTIQEFRRTASQFGAQRQESEKKAARIALENLARTAGYADPARLEWAMEAETVADLKNGALSARAGDTVVTLSIDSFGVPVLTFEKKGKAIKALPASAKKDEAIASLINRRKEIERQGSRMRQSLEEAMCRGDVFTAAEIGRLWEHPVLQPLLRSLVFVGDGEIVGYPTNDATALEDAYGATHPLSPDSRLRIAHPYDLFQTGIWDRWQHECFRHERIQPFKQVFRELYLLTEAEKGDGNVSRRYAGHQVNPKQAMALLGRRGWISSYDEGVRRTFHAEGLTVSVDSMGYTATAADIEGMTLETVQFALRGEWKPMPLSEVPPRVFSEAMRDLDLVVSVAHQGGVDPEASASTVEMRAALVREAAMLMRLDNVRLQKSHVLIDGKLGTYSIHLGSAIVHRQPGGFLCIVPVHSQHRGRLFLPFVDDDPRTAEVVSKVLLLARDTEIKDPMILEQILAVR